MTGVQLIGKDAVIERFDKLQGDSWAIFQGKQFVVSGDGSTDLLDWLQCFEKTQTTAAYILKVYEGDPPTSDGTTRPYIAALNFRVVDMYEGAGIGGHNNKVMQRLEGIEKKLNAEVEQPDDQEQGFDRVIMGWLENPEKLGMIIGAVRQLMGYSGPAQIPAAVVGAPGQQIGGFKVQEEPASGGVSEEDLVKLSSSLDELQRHDPNIVAHLTKLANLAKSDPFIFKGVLSKLDAL